MPKLIRFDEDHFCYLLPPGTDATFVRDATRMFEEFWPGKHFVVVAADEFVDLTGQHEIVPVPVQPDFDPGPILTEAAMPSRAFTR